MVKIEQTTNLTGNLTSFRTQLDEIDPSASLQSRYERYKDLLQNQNPGQGSSQNPVSSNPVAQNPLIQNPLIKNSF